MRRREGGYPLDSSGIIHVATAAENHSNTFRLSLRFTDRVHAGVLQQALDAVYGRFPPWQRE